jgi:hypothetical protein
MEDIQFGRRRGRHVLVRAIWHKEVGCSTEGLSKDNESYAPIAMLYSLKGSGEPSQRVSAHKPQKGGKDATKKCQRRPGTKTEQELLFRS